MISITNAAKRYETMIDKFLTEDKLLEASESYDKLAKLCSIMEQTVRELKLIKNASKKAIISKVIDIEDIIHDEEISEDNTKTKEIDNIKLHVVEVPTEDFIPKSFLYWIKSEETFAIKLNNLVLKGNVRNFGDKPGDFNNQNFTYVKSGYCKKNKHFRHIGSKDSLKSDIENATEKEKNDRTFQVMHDLLIQLCIDSLT